MPFKLLFRTSFLLIWCKNTQTKLWSSNKIQIWEPKTKVGKMLVRVWRGIGLDGKSAVVQQINWKFRVARIVPPFRQELNWYRWANLERIHRLTEGSFTSFAGSLENAVRLNHSIWHFRRGDNASMLWLFDRSSFCREYHPNKSRTSNFNKWNLIKSLLWVFLWASGLRSST